MNPENAKKTPLLIRIQVKYVSRERVKPRLGTHNQKINRGKPSKTQNN